MGPLGCGSVAEPSSLSVRERESEGEEGEGNHERLREGRGATPRGDAIRCKV